MRVYAARFADLDPATLYALIRLRLDVFVVEQRCVYLDLDGRDTEPDTVHMWLAPTAETPAPAAYLRILREQDGAGRIGRVCTAPAHRGNGLAGTLVRAAVQRLGDRPCVLSAQAYLADFYARLGFTVTGPQFVEDGIAHLPMRRVPTGGGAAPG